MKNLSRRLFVSGLSIVATLAAHADRLVNIPTGSKILKGTLRLDSLWEPGSHGYRRFSIGAPVGETYEAEITTERTLRHQQDRASANFAYQFAVPIVDAAPGIIFGVQDIANNTRDRLNLYAAVTFKFGQSGDYNADIPAQVTIGAGTRHGVFMGAMLPIADQFRLIAEHDGYRQSAGFELRPTKGLQFRWLWRPQGSAISAGYLVRF